MSGDTSDTVVDIDGGVMEGGGQILRIAVALSALFRKPIRVRNIRAGRSNPGLRPQHLCGLQLVKDICGGRMEGGHIGSTEITFYPGIIRGGNYKADTGTAGSVVLLLQVALPCLLFADGASKLHLCGGTNVDMAPHIDYTISVFAPVVKKFGANLDIRVIRRGYFPKGGGRVEVEVKPSQSLNPIELMDPGKVTKIVGRSFVAGSLPIKVAHIMADCAASIIREQWQSTPCSVERLKESEANAFGTGNGIIVIAESSTGCKWSGSALGKRGTPAEAVGRSAARDLLKELGKTSCVDSYLQDQLIVFMALAGGTSRILSGPLTLHTETAIHVAHILTKAKFTSSQRGTSHILECTGAGCVTQR
ncbi:RNA 3'-terminal phosphate cyclase-like [Ornithodoros turicata]|uniref:RNA 3'-terminal phosphate cyclase-like n=1 Tax=Ornithodoros turicata TaxID=34597 RepID=UPI003138DCD9